jgi:hypothetical protein
MKRILGKISKKIRKIINNLKINCNLNVIVFNSNARKIFYKIAKDLKIKN